MKLRSPLKVAVLDMQPIDPPTGGGRLRILGLYHALGADLTTLYVGTYDWPGPGFRRQMLSPSLEELLIPLSPEHFAVAAEQSQAAGGRVTIDSTFPELAHLSPDYIAAARDAAKQADIVVFSHPWIYPLVRNELDASHQLIVYDSHNVEGLLRTEILDDGGGEGSRIVRDVIRTEHDLCHAAHLVLACSHDDRVAFNRLYGVPYERMRVVPNGTFTQRLLPATAEQKTLARRALGLGPSPVALFIGSNYAPNADAAAFIANSLAPLSPHILFAIVGGVSESLAAGPRPFNLRTTGVVTDEERTRWLHASDIAINPMFGGSGTNIKMLDFMSVGLPIVTTNIGARGIETSGEAYVISGGDTFGRAINALLEDPATCRRLSQSSREQARMFFSWERISSQLGILLRRRAMALASPQPFFSIVIPTFERHQLLTSLVENLSRQAFTDFEVIIVDQSPEPWPERSNPFQMDVLYIHTDVRGPGFARNMGAQFARGAVISFVDDDCEPFPDWLDSASREFNAADIIGIEGLIISGRKDDPDWRAVTNEGFEGLGFMTANLFLRTEAFHSINGFDVAFGDVPFREDTDLGWRAQRLGAIPFSRLARVYHPPQPRAIERESLESRSRFFQRDALLLRKHPVKYVELMRREAQWIHNPYFWAHFVEGLKLYQVEATDEIRAMMPWRIRHLCKSRQTADTPAWSFRRSQNTRPGACS
jgi:glycosyltransferase involved in cell wall biosynthesis/GT2 family glycosyltransferase